ncbi:tRNA dihydrouridine synthase [Pontiella sulfatireligans]|uniref:tRNA-dihydrouridine synthase n=1 Tax=Pontiella sulfatireligans TaxID=2750658 RepID=A0A6C2ULV4_9BACT|nr:tRNA-dihydrouridine synthase [Pontiella sulfatireligans]VGO21098.1 putative tRNA-dihydrouridine synthase [Pontiella sulfatireligans]
MSFWKKFNPPIIALAPMEDVTDTVLRELLLNVTDPGALHVVMTEFVSTDGLVHPKARKRVIHRLQVTDEERRLLNEKNVKIVAQIWGNTPENYAQVVKEITEEMEFDGIDINMGCPVPKVVARGCCSGLIGNSTLAKEIIQAAQEATDLPVSVKTRIGLKSIATEEWIGHVLETKPAALTIHGRTQKQMSHGLADWSEIAKAARLRDQLGLDLPVIGNGDVLSLDEARSKCDEFGLDGAMIGRGIFDNPWLFMAAQRERTKEEKLDMLWKHTELFDRVWGDTKNFHILRRYYSIYSKGFPGAAELRANLMQTSCIADVKKVLA